MFSTGRRILQISDSSVPHRMKTSLHYHGGDICVLCFVSQKPTKWEFPLPARTDLAVKLLTITIFFVCRNYLCHTAKHKIGGSYMSPF